MICCAQEAACHEGGPSSRPLAASTDSAAYQLLHSPPIQQRKSSKSQNGSFEESAADSTGCGTPPAQGTNLLCPTDEVVIRTAAAASDHCAFENRGCNRFLGELRCTTAYQADLVQHGIKRQHGKPGFRCVASKVVVGPGLCDCGPIVSAFVNPAASQACMFARMEASSSVGRIQVPRTRM
jgi:hypothetical protein